MKKVSKLIAILLALVMCLSLVTPAFAADLTTAGGTTDSPVVLNAAAATFSVTIPTGLPIEVLTDGTVVQPDAVKIINNSAGAVKVENVAIEGQNDWVLVDYDTDETDFKVNEKKVGLKINSTNEKTADDGSFAFDATQWGVMTATDGAAGGADEYEFTYDAILAPQSATITDAVIANVIFTIGWYKGETVAQPELNEYGFYYNAPYFNDNNNDAALAFREDGYLLSYKRNVVPGSVASEYYFNSYYSAGDYTYDAATNTVTAGNRTITFSENGETLECNGNTYRVSGTTHGIYYGQTYSNDRGDTIVINEDGTISYSISGFAETVQITNDEGWRCNFKSSQSTNVTSTIYVSMYGDVLQVGADLGTEYEGTNMSKTSSVFILEK